MSVLDSIPGMKELGDTMLPDMIGICACLVPCEWCSEIQETHGVK